MPPTDYGHTPGPSRLVQTVVITGMSGSGKSTALKAFEDLGYYCVDNLPIALLPEFLLLTENSATTETKTALVMDVREKSFLDQYRSIFTRIRSSGFHLEVLFLDSADEIIIRRFSQTRRRHPLDQNGDMAAGIRIERSRLRGLREFADRIIDTSNYNVHQLREAVFTLYAPRQRLDQLVIHVMSFGFKYGVPADANLVFDVRFLPNPYFVPDLRKLSGRDKDVQDFVLEHEETRQFNRHLTSLLDFIIPQYRQEGKSYLVIAVGCTGGRHRSVTIAEWLKQYLSNREEEVLTTHRDLQREE